MQRIEIPWGIYCYDKRGTCPYWGLDPAHPAQENGFCSLLGENDWGPEGDALLWDQVKLCSFNDYHDLCEVNMPKKEALVAVCQINVIPKRPDLNSRKMIEFLASAYGAGATVAVFPEMSIPGYLIGDDWEDLAFIEDCRSYGADVELFARSLGIGVVFGNVTKLDTSLNQHDGRAVKHNTAHVAIGTVTRSHNKVNLPNYREFDDCRHFTPGNPGYTAWSEDETAFYTVSICEDGWDDDYDNSPIAAAADKVQAVGLAEGNANIHLNLSCSPFTQGKNGARNRRFGKHSEDFDALFYVNNVGVQNNGKNVFVFDGSSTVYSKGECVLALPPLVECFGIVSVSTEGVRAVSDNWLTSQQDPQIHEVLTYAIKEFCAQSGIKRTVIGLSGGVDSALSVMLHVKALGKENVIAVNLPTQFNSDTTKGIAKEIAGNLGIRYLEVPIGKAVEKFMDEVHAGLYKSHVTRDEFWDDTENIQARMRGAGVQAMLAAGFKAVFPNNGNKAEVTVGYCTLGGDHMGYLAPLGDLWKHEVYETAKAIDATFDKNILPEALFTLKPSAELSAEQSVDEGKGDPIVYWYHDKLFASWMEPWNRKNIEDTLRAYVDGTLLESLGLADKEADFAALFQTPADFVADIERWWGLFKGMGTVKRVQSPPTVVVSRRAFGFDFREAIGQVHYTRQYRNIKAKLLADV